MLLAKHYISIGVIVSIACFIAPLSYAADTADVATEPQTPTTTSTTLAAKGKQLFDSICAHCHHTTYDESRIGAPGLRGVLERHDEAWLNNWIKGPEAFAQTDVVARDLIDSNRFGLAMPTIPAMQNEDNRKAVIEYLKTLK